MFIGLDIHKQFTFCCETDDQGNVLREFRFASTVEEITRYAGHLGVGDQVALEATTNCFAFADLLKKSGATVVVSNPMQTKAIASAKVKTDKIDARVLAHLLRLGYLPEVWQPDQGTRRLRRRASHRESLTRQRTMVKNRIHSILHRNLVDAGSISDLFGAKGRAFLMKAKEALPEDDGWQLEQELEFLDHVESQLRAAQQLLAKDALADSRVRLLMTMPGISHTVAAGVVSAIGDIERFSSPKKLAGYFGLTPRLHQSGSHSWYGSINKCGSSHARWLLCEAAQAAVRVPGPLQAFYSRLRRIKGHNVAIVAVARKMACLAWQILHSKEAYHWASPLRTMEKWRNLELKAGMPKLTGGLKRGQVSKGGKTGLRSLRSKDHDLARLAQAQYEELVRHWKERPIEPTTGPNKRTSKTPKSAQESPTRIHA